MATQLIMTVGTNPLPVWVAWYHLKDKLEQPVSVRFVQTSQTKIEVVRLSKVIESDCPDTDILKSITIDPGSPKAVQNEIKGNIVDNFPNDNTKLHIHYTGGTKAMVVETVSTVEREIASKSDIDLNASYLDPRGDIGPKILSRTNLGVKDTRIGITADLSRIADLNGIEFVGTPSKPDRGQIERGKKFLNDNWPPRRYRTSTENKGAVLEYGTYAAFHRVLTEKNRDHWDLFQGVEGNRIARPGGRRVTPRPFELDVIAVLGYQVVLVSCTTSSESKEIKLKAMEAIIRAKQLGGEEAQAVTLCSAGNSDCAEIQAGLEDEMGSNTPHLRVWGKSRNDNLPNFQGLTDKFNTYLEDLKWN